MKRDKASRDKINTDDTSRDNVNSDKNGHDKTGHDDAEQEISYGLQDYDSVLKNIERRREERERRRKKIPGPLKVLFLIAVIVGAFIFSRSSFFRISNIQVDGNSYFTDEEIINMAHAEEGGNLIYEAGKSDIVSYLESNPYIKSAEVSRKFPSTLVITVEERQQMAGIVYDDEYLIIDNEGTLLRITETEPKVTLISGIVVSKIELAQKIEAENSDDLDDALTILNAMEDGDFYFKRIEVGEVNVKAYIYDSLVCTGRSDDLVNALNDGNLQQIVNTLFEEGIERGTITVREESASFSPSI